ncbi:hypothetical protein LSAT2_006835 [Lamellibrachia satsuma]|nr:hypothetical protein LSAT2_006835 [Lamellibrachia satsuma]
MHTFKHVQEGLTKYKNILKTHEKVPFPLVYLGLGRAYHRQNRFTQALVPLRKGLAENRKQGTLNWPGTKTMIAESRPLLLKVAMEELMDLCKYPPPPIAICKYKECSSNHYKVEIYESDLDFKGYVVTHCFDHCTVAYHTDCWKDIKGKLRTSDKCFTPDCGADIKEILSYDEDCTPHKKGNDRCVTVPKEKKKMVKMKLSRYKEKFVKVEPYKEKFVKMEPSRYDEKFVKASLGSKHILFSYFIITEPTELKLAQIASPESLEATHHAEGAVRSTAGVESVCFLHNVHSRFATSDRNTAQRTSSVERSPSASVSSSTRNRGTPISSRRSA